MQVLIQFNDIVVFTEATVPNGVSITTDWGKTFSITSASGSGTQFVAYQGDWNESLHPDEIVTFDYDGSGDYVDVDGVPMEAVSMRVVNCTEVIPPPTPLFAIDFTKYTSAAEFEADNPGWTVGGTGAVFDVNGFNGKGTAWLYTTTFPYAGQIASANQGAFVINAEREILTIDESVPEFAGAFIQSSGIPGVTRYLLGTQAASWNGYQLSILYQQNDEMRVLSRIANDTNGSINGRNLNSQIPFGLDSYADFAVTWNNTDLYFELDGVVAGYMSQPGTLNDPNQFGQIVIGANSSAGSDPVGDKYIKSFSAYDVDLIPAFTQKSIAWFGDSFARASMDSSDILIPQDVSTFFGGTGRVAQYSAAQEVIRRWLAERGELIYGIYGASTTENGRGYASDLNPFSQATIDAVISAAPDTIICYGSINDVNINTPASDILGDTQAIMDQWIDGIPGLQAIHYFEQFLGHKGTPETNTPDHIAESARLRGIMSGINGYRGVVVYHPTFTLWGGEDYPPEQTIGSDPTNTKTPDADIHPASVGHLKIGEIIYGAIK